MLIPRSITLSPIALAHLNFSFPSCAPSSPLSSIPDICDPSVPFYTRATSLVNQFTTEELINNTINYAPGVPRLGAPNYQWWTEALHGVAGSPGVNFNKSDPSGEYGSANNSPRSSTLVLLLTINCIRRSVLSSPMKPERTIMRVKQA